MNMSTVISAIITDLGLFGITLPYKDQITGKPTPIENVIRNVITTVTIPRFSEVQPYQPSVETHVDQLKVINRKECIYELPPMLTMAPIKYIIDVSISYDGLRGTYGGSVPSYSYGMGELAQGVAVGMLASMLGEQLRAEPSWDWIRPNKIKLYNFPNAKIKITASCNHLPNGETIEESCYASFLELATLDLKVHLYNTLKLYDSIPSAFGEIKLKIEDYQGAEAERKALLEKWDDSFQADIDEWIKFM